MTAEFRGVSHSYGNLHALTDFSQVLTPGVTALLGVNGAGKSTLLNIAAGIVVPTQGRVLVCGSDLHQRPSRHDGLRKVALMPQGPVFPPRMPVGDIVTYLTWMKGWPAGDARERARVVLERVGLGDRVATRYGALSGGMARRVAFAQALAPEPDVLLLDEPTTGLDPAHRRDMVELIRQLADSGVTVLLSSHVVEDIEDLARDVIVLHEGTVRFSGAVGELAARADPSSRRSPLESGFFSTLERTSA